MKDKYALNPFQQKELDEKLGGYNELPPNFKEITLSKFLWIFHTSAADKTYVHRQVKLPTTAFGSDEIGSAERYCTLAMFVLPDYSGIGWIEHYNGHATRGAIDAYKAQFFEFEYCAHDFKTIEQRMCWWKGECKKCGFIKAIDSSD